MSDSGRQIGDCRHGNRRETCEECRGPAYRLKPLVWEKRTDFFVSYTVSGLLVVFANHWHSQKFSEGEMRECESFDHGKQLAEAWYRAKMLEALEEITPPP